MASPDGHGGIQQNLPFEELSSENNAPGAPRRRTSMTSLFTVNDHDSEDEGDESREEENDDGNYSEDQEDESESREEDARKVSVKWFTESQYCNKSLRSFCKI
jgi:hypothetical protein